jgi:hypothetical protein
MAWSHRVLLMAVSVLFRSLNKLAQSDDGHDLPSVQRTSAAKFRSTLPIADSPASALRPDHSVFSRARNERFRDHDIFRQVLERVVATRFTWQKEPVN